MIIATISKDEAEQILYYRLIALQMAVDGMRHRVWMLSHRLDSFIFDVRVIVNHERRNMGQEDI